MTVVASAPGKIVMSGEYAVLWGAPAICMAVDRRAIVSIDTSQERRVMTPGFSSGDPWRVIDALTNGVRPDCAIELDTTSFSVDGNKVGFGSSAALTVALAAALGNTVDVFETAIRAHRELQGGAGSGVDVAAAVQGGLLSYTMATSAAEPLVWPDGLAFRVIWTGIPASTGAKLKKLAEQTPQPSRSALLLAAPRMAAAWRTADVESVLAGYAEYVDVLRQFSIDHGLGIFDAGHDKLTDAAMVDGLVYKPAGAGGGDIGVLFGRSDSELDAFLDRRADLVHGVLACAQDPNGVRLEQT